MNDRDDLLLDVFLEESLGGARPPDVSENVMRALAARMAAAQPAIGQPAIGQSSGPRPIPLNAQPADTSGSHPTLQVERSTLAGERRSRWPTWLPFVLAASLLVAVGGYWLARGGRTQAPVAAKQSHTALREPPMADRSRDRTNSPLAADRQPSEYQPDDHRPVERLNTSAAGPATGGPTTGSPTTGSDAAPAARSATGNLASEAPTGARPDVEAPAEAGPADNPAGNGAAADVVTTSLNGPSLTSALSNSSTTDAEIVALIDQTIRRHCQQANVRLSPRATDAEWCRRVYLDVIGRIPTVEELEAFLIDNARDKRARLVDLLLHSDGYLESHARFWTALWTNLLVGRGGGLEPGSLVNREALQQYLRRSFISGKPYDRLVYELVSAEGSNRPGDDNYNGAVNFLLAHLTDNATPATAKTAQIFLGMQVRCTQCHNHPFNDWKQSRFWELNSFFRQARAEADMPGGAVAGGEPRQVTLTDADFVGEGSDINEAEVYFESRDGRMHAAYPKFIDGTALDVDGRVAVVQRRRELARLMTRSDELSRALVNRLWAHFLGFGFSKPFDDLGPHNIPSHPELLQRLEREFVSQGYDLKRLTRWIVLSEPYALSSKFGPRLGNAADDPQTGTPPLFSHFYVRQMLPEQLYDSLLVATDAHLAETTYAEQQRLKDQWMRQFTIIFGTDENDEATTFDGTIAQTLVMMNGDLTRQAVSGRSGSFLADVYHDGLRREASGVGRQSRRADTIHQLYRAALARVPSKSELRVVGGLLEERGGDAVTVLEDVWWALLNSNEFILNH
jgi:hypothetical protein